MNGDGMGFGFVFSLVILAVIIPPMPRRR
jgi:hypothetical protein